MFPATVRRTVEFPSAAQNVTVTKTCMQCGAVNGPEVNTCCFCDARLSKNTHEDIPVRTSRSAPDLQSQNPPAPHIPQRVKGNLATAPDWQSEVSSRMEAYRARRRRLQGDTSQPEFTFEKPERSFEKITLAPAVSLDRKEREHERDRERQSIPRSPRIQQQAYVPAPASSALPAMPSAAAPMPAARARTLRPKHSERLEINVSQPAFDFSAAERSNSSLSFGARSLPLHSDSRIFHVAPLAQRRRAGLVDAALLLFAFGGFWSLFSALGGHFTVSSFSAVVTAATLSLLYAQYFSLFTYFGGATPGMMLCHLRVVSFDGTEPTSQQLLWRSLGYLISAGTAALGFIWALWDEDHLTWQDRISQTYLTAALDDADDSVAATNHDATILRS
jgi:uncharacterized RDD family membrane protein YckC/ribosomal protein L40E